MHREVYDAISYGVSEWGGCALLAQKVCKKCGSPPFILFYFWGFSFDIRVEESGA